MKKENHYLGNIELSESVIVTDPCYKLGSDGTLSFNNIKAGTYDCNIILCDDGFYGNMTERQLGILGTVAELKVTHKDLDRAKQKWEVVKGCILDVDSGTLGIYDFSYFSSILDESGKMKKESYSKIVELTTRKVTNKQFIDKETFLKEYLGQSYKSILDIFKLADEEEKQRQLEKKCDAEIIYDMDWQKSEKQIKLSYGSTVDERSVISATGIGDGCYRCYLIKNESNQIVGIRIKFI